MGRGGLSEGPPRFPLVCVSQAGEGSPRRSSSSVPRPGDQVRFCICRWYWINCNPRLRAYSVPNRLEHGHISITRRSLAIRSSGPECHPRRRLCRVPRTATVSVSKRCASKCLSHRVSKRRSRTRRLARAPRRCPNPSDWQPYKHDLSARVRKQGCFSLTRISTRRFCMSARHWQNALSTCGLSAGACMAGSSRWLGFTPDAGQGEPQGLREHARKTEKGSHDSSP